MNPFYILSLKHSPDKAGSAVWWRADCKGYTTSLAEAGVYDQETIEAHPIYYDNGRTTEAWYKKAVDRLATAVPFARLVEHERARHEVKA